MKITKNQSLRIHFVDLPAHFIPADAESASGKFPIAIAVTRVRADPCVNRVIPNRRDSGIASIIVPISIAFPLPGFEDSEGCMTHSPQRFLFWAHFFERKELIRLNKNAHAMRARSQK